MRRLLLGAAAAVALSATPAAADVFVFSFAKKDKEVDVDVTVDIDKDAFVFGEVLLDPEKAAEATSLVNQINTFQDACENCAEKDDVISDSANTNSGVISVNQATGNMNNQGNAVSVALTGAGDDVDGNPDTNGAFAHGESIVDQRQGFYIGLIDVFHDDDDNGSETPTAALVDEAIGPGHGVIGLPNQVKSINIAFRNAVIVNSINNNSGGIHVNQSAGNVNNQANVFTAAIGQDAGVALSDSDLGQSNWANIVDERSAFKTAQINGSINTNSGVVGVNQSSGNMANQANIFTLGAATAGLVQ